MSITSPLAGLHQVLLTVRASAQVHAEMLRKSEAATRAALIEPVLRALGWDTENVQMVEPEKTINTAWRADYALNNSAGKIDLLLEAKCLGSNLEKFAVVQQLLSYAFGFDVLKVVLSDGINWHFYREFKPGHSASDFHFNLLEDDTIYCALQLIQWLDAAQSGHGITTVSSGPAKSNSSALVSTKDVAQAQQARIAVLKKNRNDDFTDLAQLHLPSLKPGQKPEKLRLPNGNINSVFTWKDILLEVCCLVLATNPNLHLPLPDKAGKKRFLISNTKPEKGSSTLASYNGQSVFIGTHYSAADCVANALYALSQLPANQKKVSLAVSF
ncbi:hypothetical protein [Hymenobacter ruricola]|uniref:Type I restriction enzyme R protein N-terminal domain-containing protein n=1 Tax=Hymenobacter ruricola TaxID=2791023 RepID=A0ABS0I4B8_9BACT|nr:hypothetical protein [Hymenobacter ruricola]MBF9221823.1 hypothetical protein [Hymenobacter ruricola]